jgi:hypothetical protein
MRNEQPMTRILGHADSQMVGLTAVYLADRSDHSASLTNAVAMLGAGIAYATGTLAFFKDITATREPLLIAMLPLPLWMVVLYHALVVVASMIRAASIVALERRILSDSGLPTWFAERTGFKASHTAVFNLAAAAWPHRLASLISYAGTGLVTVVYSAFVLVRSGFLTRPWLIGAATIYFALTVLWLAVWFRGTAKYYEYRLALDRADSPHPTGAPVISDQSRATPGSGEGHLTQQPNVAATRTDPRSGEEL